jgi:hypothetical protein
MIILYLEWFKYSSKKSSSHCEGGDKMNRAWILVLISLLFLGASAWAQATVTVTNGPYTLNPATSDVTVNYSFVDPANSGPAYVFYYYLSSDDTLDVTMDELVDTADGFVWVSECDNGDVTISPGMSCTHDLAFGSRPDGINYLFLDARYSDSGNVEQPLDVSDAVQTTFDSTPPFITGPTFTPSVTSGTWSAVATVLTATCADSTACTLEYKIGSSAFASLPVAGVSIAQANGNLVIQSTDAAGNISDTTGTPFDLKIDTTAPTGTFKVNGSSVASSVDVNTTSPVLEITLSDSASGSGINTSTFVLNQDGTAVGNQPTLSGGVATYTAALTDGQTAVFTVVVSDNAGNPGGTLSQTIRVDASPPTGINATAPSETSSFTPQFSSIGATVTGFGTLGAGAKVVFQCTPNGTPVEIDYAASISSFNITQNGCSSANGSRTVNVKVRDSVGNLSTESKDVTINYDTTAPATIDGGNITPSSVDNDSATLDWPDGSDGSTGSGIDGYEVYRSTSNNSSGASNVSSPSASTFNDSGLSACTDYYYWVKAVDDVGNESGFGSSLNVKTGCPNNPDDPDDDPTPSPGPDGGGNACNVTVTLPAAVYAGETITLSASGANYAGGKISAYETGKVGANIGFSATTKNQWSGSYTIPNSIGKTINVRFKADSCTTAVLARVIKDPATRPAAAASNPASDEGATTPTTLTAPPALPEPGVLSFVLENIASMMTNAGFNAENAQMKTDAENAITEWNVTPTVKMVPVEGEAGMYALQLIYSLSNTGNKGSIKMVVDVPKSFASVASAIDASSPMTVLKEDPLVQFELSDLFEGQTIDIVLSTKDSFTFGVASSKMEAVQALTLNPPLIFSSGVGKAVERKEAPADSPALLTGFVGFVGNTAPFVLGFLLIVGLIFVSVRVVRGSVAGADNPILRSSSGIKNNGPHYRTPSTPVRGRKTWKSGEVRLNDNY